MKMRRVHIRTLGASVSAVAIAASILAGPVGGESTNAVDPRVGNAGTDIALPATDSAVRVSGRDEFANLQITVNQTRDLVNQTISISWTGGNQTGGGGNPFRDNYLQMMQCWGDDNGLVPSNPGPPPEQCVFGAYNSDPTLKAPVLVDPSGTRVLSRVVSQKSWPDHFDARDGVEETSTGFLWKPFKAVDGGQVDVPFNQDCNPNISSCFYWLNSYFDRFSTNEIGASATKPNGTGTQGFEVETAAELPGLGCGRTLPSADGASPRAPKCWLVIVPRGDAVNENAGVPSDNDGIMTSPLSAAAWKNRIAVPLEFNPVRSNCDSSLESRQLVGSELSAIALGSWIPNLCARPGSAPFAYTPINDEQARRQVVGSVGGPGMALVSRPVDPASIDPENPVVYAPIALSSLVVGFNVERQPDSSAPAEEKALALTRMARLNLTPRLVAKLLTQSYLRSFIMPSNYSWAEHNPKDLGLDPDFLQFNSEFDLMAPLPSRNFSGLVAPGGKSDAAARLWEYVLADPEARAWLDGAPDQWGMRVNPVYSTSATLNPLGFAFGDPLPDSFPKDEPYCHVEPPFHAGNVPDQPLLTPPPYCGGDHLPYSAGFRDAARRANLADDGAKTVFDGFAQVQDKIYRREGPQGLGSRKMLAATDSASAARYGIQTASLSRPGDNGLDREFVAPGDEGMIRAMEAMAPREEPAMLEPDLSAEGAYPLTMLTYAILTPLSLSEQQREDYAAFIEYAASKGQEPGTQTGKLPKGYTPLSEELKERAFLAALVTRNLRLLLLEEPLGPATTPLPISPTPLIPQQPVDKPAVSKKVRSSPISSPAPEQVSQPISLSSNKTTSTPAKSTGRTPLVDLASGRFAAPALLLMAMAAAWVAEVMTRRTRAKSRT